LKFHSNEKYKVKKIVRFDYTESSSAVNIVYYYLINARACDYRNFYRHKY